PARRDRLRQRADRPRRAVQLLQWRPAAAGRVLRERGMNQYGDALHNGVAVDDTFAEAFPMKATRLLITAHTLESARHAAAAATGFATSVIGCGCEAGIECELAPERTPDGRPGIALLLFAMSGKELAKQIERRVGQCVLTCPTTAVFAGIA